MGDLLVAVVAWLLVVAAVGWCLDRWVLVWQWWPLVGPEWCAARPWRRRLRLTYLPGPETIRAETPGDWDTLGRTAEGSDWAGEPDEDDEWADQLHHINHLVHLEMHVRGQMGDLTRPIADQTYYEVEAVIRGLGVAEWLPERLRAAA